MLSKLRHHLVLLLFVALPFHALFVTVGTKLIEGSGHPPHSLLALWKEVLMALIFLVAIIELFPTVRSRIAGIRRGEKWIWRISLEKGLILALLILAFVIGAHSSQLTAHSFVFGFKYLFVPLIFFAVLATLSWDEDFLEKKLFPALLLVGGIVSLYGVITFFVPQSFFTFLGYSDAHSLYAPGSSLSAFQQISGTSIRRIQSAFSGPNQLGLWLLIPWSIGVVQVLREKVSGVRCQVLGMVGIALVMTFSRSAWIAAFIITVVAIGTTVKGKKRMNILATLISAVVLLGVMVMLASPALINRSISNRHHFERVREGIMTMMQHPMGLGLGSAGPASNRTSDACIYFEESADISWAKDRTDLCLFVANEQVQPLPEDRSCRCPVLPENWYVQVGIELGMAGFTLFVLLTAVVARRLVTGRSSRDERTSDEGQSMMVFLIFIGVSVAALFLHAWEDSAVAYTVWGIAGIALQRRNVS